MIDARAGEMVRLRRHLHMHPEPSGQEWETSAHVAQLLTGAGIEAHLGPEGRGVVAEIPGEPEAPCIALRADLDALWLEEAGTAEYRSRRPGVMHACGHDGHTAVVLGAMLGLQAARESGVLPAPVRCRAIFQPSEEVSAGALQMIRAGALHAVDAILSLHMDPSRPAGRIGVRYGPLTAACDGLQVTVEGRGGHAARPHESIDPIAAAAQLVSSIYLFIPRGTDSHDPVVVTIGQFLSGDSPNVIPERALLRGTIRTLAPGTRERTREHLRKLARGVAEGSGTRIEVQFDSGPGSVQNDVVLTDLIRTAAAELLGADRLDVITRPSMGSEDFSYYLEHVPGAMFRLGCSSPAVGNAPLHAPTFDLDESALPLGAKVLARAVALWSVSQCRERE